MGTWCCSTGSRRCTGERHADDGDEHGWVCVRVSAGRVVRTGSGADRFLIPSTQCDHLRLAYPTHLIPS